MFKTLLNNFAEQCEANQLNLADFVHVKIIQMFKKPGRHVQAQQEKVVTFMICHNFEM